MRQFIAKDCQQSVHSLLMHLSPFHPPFTPFSPPFFFLRSTSFGRCCCRPVHRTPRTGDTRVAIYLLVMIYYSLFISKFAVALFFFGHDHVSFLFSFFLHVVWTQEEGRFHSYACMIFTLPVLALAGCLFSWLTG
jgi:hypothetical protein